MPRWCGWSINWRGRGFCSVKKISLADVALLAYTRVAQEGGFHLDGYASLRRWIGESERALGLKPAC